jgi:phosphoserine phosphatase
MHLHERLGVAEKAREIAMPWQRGEISYAQWARLEAALWRGVPRRTMMAALESNPLRPGARELVGWFTARAIPCVGISTGLSIFNEVTARELGMTEVICNEPHFEGDVCTGQVSVRVCEDNKGDVMDEVLARYAVSAAHVVAFGDGSADIPLLTKAALGIAVCPSNDKLRDCAGYVQAEPLDEAIKVVEKHFNVNHGFHGLPQIRNP